MDLKELKKYIKSKMKETKEEYSFLEFSSLEIIKKDKEGISYHINIPVTLDFPEEKLIEKFNVKSVGTTIGFDFNLSHYTDEWIKYTIDEVFRRFRTFCNNTQININKDEKEIGVV